VYRVVRRVLGEAGDATGAQRGVDVEPRHG
jgi:hypothetical protein